MRLAPSRTALRLMSKRLIRFGEFGQRPGVTENLGERGLCG